MKILINYDLFNAILNSKEELNGFKVYRNQKRSYAYIAPFCFLFNYFCTRRIPNSLLALVLQIFSFNYSLYLRCLNTETDPFKTQSINDLKKLLFDLKEYLSINTDYDLLLDSTILSREFRIEFNPENLLQIIETKNISIYSYDSFGEVKEDYLEQVHPILSDDYVLSKGKAKRKLKLAYSNI